MRELFTGDFRWLLGAQICFGMAFSATLLIPGFVAGPLAGSAADVGRVAAFFTFATVVALPVAGIAVDRLGRRCFMAVGCGLMAVSAAGLGLVAEVGPLLYGLRAASGVAFALYFVAGSTLAADLAPQGRLAQTVGLYSVTLVATNALAPALGERLVDEAGWHALFAAIAFAAGAAGGLLPLLPSSAVAATQGGRALLAELVTCRAVRAPLAVAVLGGVVFAAMVTFVPAVAAQHEGFGVGGFFASYAAAAIVARVGAGGWIDGPTRAPVALAAAALYGISPALLSQPDPLRLVWVGLAFGAAHGLLYPALNALVLEAVSARARGSATAAFYASFNLGWAVGALALGQVASRAGFAAAFEAAAIAFAPALPVLALGLRTRRSQVLVPGQRAAP